MHVLLGRSNKLQSQITSAFCIILHNNLAQHIGNQCKIKD